MRKYNFNNRHNQSGFSIALVLGVIMILGILAYIGSTIFGSIIGGMQRTNLVVQSSQALTQAAYTLTTETTRNASGIPVAAAFLVGSPSPVGGGIVPTTSAAPKLDSFGTNLGYCTNSALAQADPVFAVVSAGANKVFNTTCAQALAGVFIGDDKIVVRSVSNVIQGVGGTVYFGDPVAAVADLANLTAAAIKPGQLRTVLADGSIYINATGIVGATAWTKADAASSSGGSTGGSSSNSSTVISLNLADTIGRETYAGRYNQGNLFVGNYEQFSDAQVVRNGNSSLIKYQVITSNGLYYLQSSNYNTTNLWRPYNYVCIKSNGLPQELIAMSCAASSYDNSAYRVTPLGVEYSNQNQSPWQGYAILYWK